MRIPRKLVILIGLLALLSLFLPASTVWADEASTFPDLNLEAAIREEIGKPVGDIYRSDLQVITELIAPDRGIANIAGLEYCTNLQKLILDSNPLIRDLSPLTGLTSLQELYLFFNSLSDISPLTGLENLEVLSLEDNYISDLSPLAGLENLRVLSLEDNYMSDISPLAGLVNLEWLHLANNDVSDLSPLAGLAKLRFLELSFNKVSDISPLLANPGLGAEDTISLRYNPLSAESLNDYIAQLEQRGVNVSWNKTPATGAETPAAPEPETSATPGPESETTPEPGPAATPEPDLLQPVVWIIVGAVALAAVWLFLLKYRKYRRHARRSGQ